MFLATFYKQRLVWLLLFLTFRLILPWRNRDPPYKLDMCLHTWVYIKWSYLHPDLFILSSYTHPTSLACVALDVVPHLLKASETLMPISLLFCCVVLTVSATVLLKYSAVGCSVHLKKGVLVTAYSEYFGDCVQSTCDRFCTCIYSAWLPLITPLKHLWISSFVTSY